MDKKQAQELIKETFESPFDKVRFTNFIKNLLNSIDKSKAFHAHGYVKEGFSGVIKTYERIGTYTSANDKKIDIIIVYLQKGFSLDHARVTQRNFAGRYLADRGTKHAGLFAFVSPEESDWRFSLVKMDYKFEQTKSGSMKVKEEFTPARRWSFLVGENEKSHTAQSRLVKILANDEQDPTLEEIQKAFDIETVTKEFFLKYRELFLHTKEELDKIVTQASSLRNEFEAKGVDTVNFAKKLLGQIIFLYFLQKKGWFGVGRDNDWGTGAKHFLRELFEKKHGDYNNFFNDILEPLFYDALRIDRSHDDGYYSRFNCKIPFLNGGLFDPIGNYDWVHIDILLPNELFSNQTKTREGDIGTGILDVFDRYNFTVKEDEPLEKEVAIDPELLGKSYEKFNAIRPDNYAEFKKALKSGKKGEENKFNKKFGVYYTPREIVHYMCRQSLINYLATEFFDSHSRSTSAHSESISRHSGPISRHSGESRNPVPSKEDIETLIHTGEQFSENEALFLKKEQKIKNGEQKTTSIKSILPDSIRKNAKLLDDKLAEITVCDPAVGSGAFPVGMMSEIVKVRNVLSVFIDDKKRKIYNFKRQCIEHSLYGVDIDQGAVEIAKLRLWLSLVVDEEDIKNIKPLPNLDYKIMQGNSLIELLSTESLVSSIDHRRTELVKELKISKDELFNIAIPTQKENKRREIDILMKKLFEYDRDKQIKKLKDNISAVKSQKRLFEDDKDRKKDEKKIRVIENRIEEIKNIDIPSPTEHFEWHVNYSEIFQAKGGFDVVIANPPYVSYGLRGGQKMTAQEKEVLRKAFPNSAEYKISLYALFMDKAIQISKSEGGVQAYIVPDSFLLGRYFSKIRDCILQLNEIKHILLLPYNVFDATVGFSVVYVFQRKLKINERHNVTARFAENNEVIEQGRFKELSYLQSYFSSLKHHRFRLFFDLRSMNLISKIEKGSSELGEFLTGRTGVRSLIGQKNIISKEKKANTWQKGLISGGQISKYKVAYEGDYINIDPKLLNKGGWNYDVIHNPKLLLRQTGDSLTAAIDYNYYYHLNNIHSFAPNNKKLDLLYLLALINSNLLDYYYKSITLETGRAMAQTDIETLENLPIKKITIIEQKPFIEIVDKILFFIQSNDYKQNSQKQAKVKGLEEEIDQLVYKLYDLTREEIKIVEGGLIDNS